MSAISKIRAYTVSAARKSFSAQTRQFSRIPAQLPATYAKGAVDRGLSGVASLAAKFKKIMQEELETLKRLTDPKFIEHNAKPNGSGVFHEISTRTPGDKHRLIATYVEKDGEKILLGYNKSDPETGAFISDIICSDAGKKLHVVKTRTTDAVTQQTKGLEAYFSESGELKKLYEIDESGRGRALAP